MPNVLKFQSPNRRGCLADTANWARARSCSCFNPLTVGGALLTQAYTWLANVSNERFNPLTVGGALLTAPTDCYRHRGAEVSIP